MHVLRYNRLLLVWSLPLLALFPGALEGQLRTVVSNEIAVSGTEAALRLDFGDQHGLSISLRDGQVLVDEEVVGSYTRGDAMDLAWRSLLGDVISLDDGPLANALNDWMPPGELTGSAAEVAAALDRAIEGALALPEASQDPSPSSEISVTLSNESALLGALLSHTGSLQGLAKALEEASLENFVLRIGEDMDVEAGDELDQSLILVDGDLDVRGVIRGDVVVTGGSVRLLDGGRITGDLRVVDGEVETLGGEVDGEIFVPSTEEVVSLDSRELKKLREDVEREVRRDLRSTASRRERPSPNWLFGIFGNVGRAIAGLLENLVTLLMLVVFGVLIVHFAGDKLEVVATTARRAPAQSAMVGLAGGFLLIPVWILGIVALAVSIIGIPVLLAWIPLFPIAVAGAALLGYVAVARNIGEWVSDQEYRGLEWIRGSNTFYVVAAGLAALMVPAVAASAVRILGLGFLQGLLGFLGSAVTFVALAIGMGAVLLTRGGRIRPYAAYYDFDDEGWAEPDDMMDPTGPFPGDPAAEADSPQDEAPSQEPWRDAAPGSEAPNAGEGENPKPDEEDGDTHA